jgi:hypothetical protein
MSRWLGTLAGNMESLLERVDQAAGQALHTDDADIARAGSEVFYEQTVSIPDWHQTSHTIASMPSAHYSPAQSFTTQTSTVGVKSSVSDVVGMSPTVAVTSKTMKVMKDPDQELFEFLNSAEGPSADSSHNGGGSVGGGVVTLKDSRPTSSMSSRSRPTPEGSVVADVPPVPTVMRSSPPVTFMTTEERDNEVMRDELSTTSRDMHALLHRLQSSQDELGVCQRQLESQRRQLLMSENSLAEMRRREADAREALAAKDAQIGVLRTRLEEADRELEVRGRQLADLSTNQDRLLVEQSSTSGVQRQTLDAMQEKLNDIESTLNRERDEHRRACDESSRHHSRLEADKQSLMLEISSLQKSLNRERSRCSELGTQLKSIRSQADAAKQELADYKDKASRILQSKEKLIFSLKDSGGSLSSGKCTGAELAVLVSELESARQEKDVVREQLQTTQLALESLRAEMSELESQMQHDAETARAQTNSLDEQLRAERRRREDVEFDVTKQKQELRSVHDELVKQKSGFLSRIQGRDDEISRLRSQLVAKSMNASNQEELENRLRALTESLIQKQTTLESLSTEKNSLLLQLERMEKQCREAETSALRAASANVNMSAADDTEDARHRLPGFMSQSPFDGNVTRRVKMAAGVIDRLGIHLGVFLRRYPVARVLVVLYMGLLHLWVMLVMLTYQPEMHHSDYQQQAGLPLPP